MRANRRLFCELRAAINLLINEVQEFFRRNNGQLDENQKAHARALSDDRKTHRDNNNRKRTGQKKCAHVESDVNKWAKKLVHWKQSGQIALRMYRPVTRRALTHRTHTPNFSHKTKNLLNLSLLYVVVVFGFLICNTLIIIMLFWCCCCCCVCFFFTSSHSACLVRTAVFH